MIINCTPKDIVIYKAKDAVLEERYILRKGAKPFIVLPKSGIVPSFRFYYEPVVITSLNGIEVKERSAMIKDEYIPSKGCHFIDLADDNYLIVTEYFVNMIRLPEIMIRTHRLLCVGDEVYLNNEDETPVGVLNLYKLI